MEPLYLITLAYGFLQLCIATLSLCCAAVILFRFRAHLLRALPAALGFAGYALLEAVDVVHRFLNQAMLLGAGFYEGGGIQAYTVGTGCLSLTAGVAVAVGLALVATARTEASS